MSGDDPFLRAIADNPDDDASRLVYADWLDEHGEPERAEFIRLQCERQRLPDGDPRGPALRDRENALLGEYEAPWLEPLRALGVEAATFRRGLVAEVEITPADLAANAGALFRRAPIQAVKLHRGDLSALRRVVALPEAARLRALDLSYSYWHNQDPVTVVADAPRLMGLRSLSIGFVRVSPANVDALAGSPHLANLTELTLRDTELGDAGTRALAESALLARLTTLNVDGNDISPAAAAALLTSPRCEGLTHLDVSNNGRLGVRPSPACCCRSPTKVNLSNPAH